jgi:succinate dehydrogenase / fumarate reductase membrane anchor subunit
MVMASTEKIGPKRLVVGAHYGTFEYLAQRVTAIIMAIYTLVLLIGILTMSGFTYQGWHNLFTFTVVMIPIGQILASLAMISLAWHAWIGIRDIWMDYIGHVGVRLLMMVLTLLWLIGSVVYFINILWRN